MRIALALTLLMTLTVSTAFAPAKKKSFQGTVTYEITYTDVPEEMAMFLSMMPTEMTQSFKGKKTRITQAMMGMEQVIIMDLEAETMFMLMDMMDKRVAVDMSDDMDSNTEEGQVVTFDYVDGEKEILGYKCKKAIMNNVDGTETEVWYTKKLKPVQSEQFEGLDGFPMQYITSVEGMNMHMTAKSVEKKKIDDSVFEIPGNYERMTMEEFQSMSMGG